MHAAQGSGSAFFPSGEHMVVVVGRKERNGEKEKKRGTVA